ncbi:MAG: DNA adenine methylase [Myxococcota bacterium]
MIKYLGSKRVLLPAIVAGARALVDRGAHVLDLFSGTSRVGHALKAAGYRVTANDQLAYAATLARCYVAADAERWTEPAQALLAELQELPGAPGYVTRVFCEEARYFQPKNGARIDAIRTRIAELDLPSPLEAIALTSLMEAADRVDSTTGVQMAYLKRWAARAHNDLSLRLPALLPGPGDAREGDAIDAAAEVEADLAYLDPPYNQHSYLGNYHVWETLVRWDAPEAYGVARKRVDVRERKSDFNSKRRIREAFAATVAALRAPRLLVSQSDEGHLPAADVHATLAERGEVGVVATDFKRYVGAQIGIHNPQGERVGTVKKLRNQELLYVVAPTRAEVERATSAIREVLAPQAPSEARR